MCRYSEFFWSAFPVFGLNSEIYSANIRFQSKCTKIRVRKTLTADTFYTVAYSNLHKEYGKN